ncbi:MAG TPA: response regulator transcription factor, partial [Actinomycetes bacterium]|nr:response regulator transcription factor [Actinomycetes bacterium]
MAVRRGGGDGPGQRPARVFVVDDHAVVRRGLRACLEVVDDLEVVGEAADAEAALAAVAALAAAGRPPEVVLVDLLLPGMDGVAATAALRRRHPGVAVVAMTSPTQAAMVHGALRAGAGGYLLTDAGADEVAAAVRAARAGGGTWARRGAGQLARSLVAPAPAAVGSLTGREREGLVLVAQGLPNRQVAEVLVLSERAARTHVSDILGRLGVASRTQAALLAVREGVAPAPRRPSHPAPPPNKDIRRPGEGVSPNRSNRRQLTRRSMTSRREPPAAARCPAAASGCSRSGCPQRDSCSPGPRSRGATSAPNLPSSIMTCSRTVHLGARRCPGRE